MTNERAETHGDVISRQAAIDSFRYDDDGSAWSMDEIIYRLEQFPSAESYVTDTNVGDIQPDSKELSSTHKALDIISRQAAIDALGGHEPVGDPSKMDDDDVAELWERVRCISIINNLPSAEPEWEELLVICDCCGHAIRVKRR